MYLQARVHEFIIHEAAGVTVVFQPSVLVALSLPQFSGSAGALEMQILLSPPDDAVPRQTR